MKTLVAVGSLLFLSACASDKPASTQYTKSGNCGGPSVSTLRFAPEPTARLFPEAVWMEECPDGKFYLRIGNDGAWKPISKAQADRSATMLKTAGRTVVRVVD
jgi:hypothetical protein